MTSLSVKPNTQIDRERQESDHFHPESNSTQEKAHNPAPLQKRKNIRSSVKWTVQENQIYAQCILEYEHLFVNQRVRRQKKVFKIMEVQMEGRKTSEQCRGHHKKFTEKYGSIENIVKVLKAKKQKKLQLRHLINQKNSRLAESEEANQSGQTGQALSSKQQNQKKRGRKPKNKTQVAPYNQLKIQLSYVSTYLTL